jgi:hypothetical protein
VRRRAIMERFVTTRVVRLVVVLCIVINGFTTAPAAAQGAESTGALVPPNIRIDSFLTDAIEVLRRKSATFRRQCDTIRAAGHVRITITAAWMPRLMTEPRARASISRFVFGHLRAAIEVPTHGDHAELIPHELEHVIEQIEGIDLPSLASAGRQGISRVADGSFETDRAKAAGLAAAAEVYGETDPALKGAITRVGRMWRAIGSRTRERPRAHRPAPPGR